ncbi:GntR family transcriptional regulator [Rhodococcus sp. 06-156-3C]|uniref:GntR family transcriptional regulator n=1 Tax=Nocardiaceae TaxID=85025 RepID=UPI0005230280|nr:MULTISPECIES: GntR family transcriptional regulator [Rhodococcus]OZD11022.1 GntR family transcriptional regulator [Rhodococcus sp. 06-156-4C]OZD14437.1 GntR family transcriptional regulator [Rhodococcus sp. 06-156-4a]OZD24771.1 GntR family transcriptional regulator [Rhodococcus sp. 06-156-3C]OZD27745.1 GntR family transcriptional regulator [Rhodococcus sp. 06-156-3b]OZD39726.1 GntR family transcriptional regulator [Rhodococcus sp. 06-156-3]
MTSTELSPSATGHPRSTGGSAGGRQTFSRRVHDLLLASVRSGLFVEDQKLVEDHLINAFDASRNAVREALRQLAEVGVVERHPRSGTIVVRTGVQMHLANVDILGGSSERVELEITEQRMVPSTPLMRVRLATTDARVRMIENTFSLGSEVIGVRTAYFRAHFNATSYTGSVEMRNVVEQFFGSTVAKISTTVGSSIGDARTNRLLGITPGSAVLSRQQTFFDPEDRPIQTTFDNYRADRVTFSSEHSPDWAMPGA